MSIETVKPIIVTLIIAAAIFSCAASAMFWLQFCAKNRSNNRFNYKAAWWGFPAWMTGFFVIPPFHGAIALWLISKVLD